MQAKTYRLSPRRKLLLWGMAAAFCAFPLLLVCGGVASGESAILGAGFIVALIMAPFAIYLGFCASYPQLSIQNDGFECRGTIGFTKISVPWNNVERLRSQPGSEGFILRSALDNPAALRWRNWTGVMYAGAPLYDAEQQQLIQEARFVPIDAFGAWFERGDLLAAIRKFVPSLVTEFEAERAAATQARASDKKALLLVFVISGLIILASIAFAIIAPHFSPSTAARLAGIMEAILTILSWAAGLGMLLYAVVNMISAYSFFKQKQWFPALLWLAMGAIQLLVVIAMIGTLLD